MADKFHINDNGEPAKCHAHKRPCPKGGEESHGDTPEEVQAKFEEHMKSQEIRVIQKTSENDFQFATDRHYFSPEDGVEVIHHTDNAETLKEAKRLSKMGRFVVITEHEELTYDEAEEPYEDDFDSEDEYEDAVAEYDHKIDMRADGDDVPIRAEYSTRAIGYKDREEFLNTVKDESNDLVNGNSNSIMYLENDRNSSEGSQVEAYSARDYDSGNDIYFDTKVTVFNDNMTE